MKSYVKPMVKKTDLVASGSIADPCWAEWQNARPDHQYVKDVNSTYDGWIVYDISGCSTKEHIVYWCPGYVEGTKTPKDLVSGNQMIENGKLENGQLVAFNPQTYIDDMMAGLPQSETAWKGGDLTEIFDGPKDS